MRQRLFLITAGPTREPLDPVRFISNRSSGKMGYALAEAALKAGHRVKLISGPVALPCPKGAQLTSVETAAQMRKAALQLSRKADVIIMTAAVADYAPIQMSKTKLKKHSERLVLKLQRTPDILAELGRKKRKNQLLIGFAAETDNLLTHARGKLKNKNLDWIVANQVGGKNSPFESDLNQVTLISREFELRKFPRMSKRKLASRLICAMLPS